MDTQTIQGFNVIGVSARTTNENGQAEKDTPALWGKFMSEGVLQKIPNKVDDTIYCVYTDYEKDQTKPYTIIIGCKVSSLDDIPEGMIGKAIEAGNYAKYVAKGNMMQGIVQNKWEEIGKDSSLPRAYKADFDVYDQAQNPENGEVDIFVSVK